MVTPWLIVQPFESVTVQLNDPADNPLAVEVLLEMGDQEYE
jgi:hypothetical protein